MTDRLTAQSRAQIVVPRLYNVRVNEPLGVYIHIPFCRAICPFCTFATAPRSERDERAYLSALAKEIQEARPLGSASRLPVDSVYFGGGTPSVLDARQVGALLEAVRGRFDVEDTAESSLEIDPGTADEDKLEGYRDAGINRLSIGAQSLNEDVLRSVGRQHGVKEIFRSFDAARRVGFDNINVDLMVGLPGEDMDRDLEDLALLAPEHASVYMLDVSEKLPQGRELKLGNRALPDEVHTLDAFRKARDVLEALGLRHYEISNYALPGRKSRHNLKYWTDEPYLGFGASAHSYIDGVRFWNVRTVKRYVECMGSEGKVVDTVEPFDGDVRAAEHLFTGLRKAEGVSLKTVQARYGVSVLDRYGDGLRPYIDLGLVQISDDVMRLTESGFMVSNEIFQVFL